MNQLQMGAIQGMLVSSVASTNLGPRFGLVNLPFLIDSFDKLDKFLASGKLVDHFLMAMDHQGIMAFDITTYGNYGWASTVPVKVLEDLKKVKIRIAESAVNKLSYESWGINPIVMPWPEMDIALKQDVINALDHTLIVCRVQNKFEVCKYFTQINYAQGLFIVLFNKAWFKSLPADLQKVLTETIRDVCKQNRVEARAQEDQETTMPRPWTWSSSSSPMRTWPPSESRATWCMRNSRTRLTSSTRAIPTSPPTI